MSSNIQDISDTYLCSSCGACKAVCPKDCISFHFTSMGRKEAQVGSDCIDCGLCRKVCPTVDTYNLHERYADRLTGDLDKIYVGRATDSGIYANAQSGGATTAILKYLFETGKIDGALVCEMSYGITPIVQGKIIRSVEELASSQKSCYTPVDLLSSLRNVSSFESLAVVGLPCHIEGVVNLVQTSNRFSNIKYKLGLICDRTLCAGIQDYLAWKYQSSEFKIEWRKKDFSQGDKYYSYRWAPMVINSKDGGLKVVSRNVRKALKDMYTSPRCRVCYDKLNTHSDITLGDPWGMQQVDWEHGDSLIITRTELGSKIVDEMQKEGLLKLSDHYELEDVIRGQQMHRKKEQLPVYSKAFALHYPGFDSFLLHQGDYLKESAVKEEKLQLQEFIQNDRKDKKELFELAEKNILSFKKAEALKKNVFYKFVQKIKRLIKKL